MVLYTGLAINIISNWELLIRLFLLRTDNFIGE